jgi:hypothetical protein
VGVPAGALDEQAARARLTDLAEGPFLAAFTFFIAEGLSRMIEESRQTDEDPDDKPPGQSAREAEGHVGRTGRMEIKNKEAQDRPHGR